MDFTIFVKINGRIVLSVYTFFILNMNTEVVFYYYRCFF